jgi:hypothetical protein
MADEKPALALVKPPSDAADLTDLWLDPALGDGLTDTCFHNIPVGKPKDFFRVHPGPDWRRRAEIYTHKPEGQIEEQNFIIAKPMLGRIEEARTCTLDHGCAHGPASHGAGPKGCLDGAAEGVLETHRAIWRVNRARIRRADLVFAYINETDCFGTLIELGYAAALNKPITIGIGRNIEIKEFDDLWMARQCATMGDALLGSPNETFKQFLLRVSGAAR